MKTYKYFAIRKDGTKVEGKIEAETDKEARSAIVALNLYPTRIVNPDESVYSETAVRKKQAEEDFKIISLIISITALIGLPFALYSEHKQIEEELSLWKQRNRRLKGWRKR